MKAAVRLPGTHRVKKQLASRRVAFYWYRCRGGDLLQKFEGENLKAALAAEARGAAMLAATYAQAHVQPNPSQLTIRDLVVRYKAAPNGYLRLAPTTRRSWARWLDEIVSEFGTLPTQALGAKGVRSTFIKWRDRRAATPRTADYGIQVLKRLLSYSLDCELIDVNPAEGIEAIYRNNRAAEIVEDAELRAILTHVTPRAALAIRLAAATGIRRGDLVSIKWSDIEEFSIEFATSKSNGKIRSLVPLVPEAQELVAELRADRQQSIAAGKVPSAFVLTTKHGGPWTKDAVTQAFIRGATAAGVDKHLHDLRGTAATRFVRAGLSDGQVADILGWEPTQVAKIKKRYVDRERIAQGVVAQLERARKTG